MVTVAPAMTEMGLPMKVLGVPDVLKLNVVPLLMVIEPLPGLEPVVRANVPAPTIVPPL